MNRLILIGNGFDLAHGLKTRYNDFILWYLKKCYEIAFNDGKYDDDVLCIKKVISGGLIYGEINTVPKLIDHLYEIGFASIINNHENIASGHGFAFSNPFRTQFKNDFFWSLIAKCEISKWVEIENEYYDQLKKILHSDPLRTKQAEKLENLNKSFSFIKEQLEDFLKTIQPWIPQAAFNDILASPINRNELLKTNLARNVAPKETMILNFNYTDTIEQYLQNTQIPKNITVNYIHGKLGDSQNPIIFGFGDELDADYAKMELEKTKGYFEHIKSFGYFKTSNYYNLIRFLDSDEYQVFILGHSCGLSDRTMLNMIFEHDNCKSIKIYYYENKEGQNNFTELTQEISRHFKDKAMMRRKIVSIDKSSPMPQVE